jgi:hypothetical protein
LRPLTGYPALLLYSTEGCHLCERADALVRRWADRAIETVEIADDEALLERYGTRIPVLRRADIDRELDWPFDEAAIRALLAR